MTCEEYQLVVLDSNVAEQDGRLQREAREHVRDCPHCAAFQNSWSELRSDLRGLAMEEQEEQAPSRVEMRLRQEFRTIHKTFKRRRYAVIASWALAAAAVLVGAIGWMNWRQERSIPTAGSNAPTQSVRSPQGVRAPSVPPAGPELGEVLVASNGAGEFTLLPSSMPGFFGDSTVVHVQMQRGALGALGLTVNEEHAADWIEVDLLLGDDGQPQAVRLPQSAN